MQDRRLLFDFSYLYEIIEEDKSTVDSFCEPIVLFVWYIHLIVYNVVL